MTVILTQRWTESLEINPHTQDTDTLFYYASQILEVCGNSVWNKSISIFLPSFQCSFPNSDPLPYSRVRPHQYTVSKKQKSLLLTHLPIRWTQRSSSSIIVVCLGRQSQSNTRNSHTVLVSTKLPWESTYIYIK